jgi:2'-5' RNA ligase
VSRGAAAPIAAGDRRTALAVVVDEAEALVGSFRRRHHRGAVERRIPPHVTILVPFAAPATLDAALTAALERLYGSLPSFAASLARVAAFPRCVWLAPEPRERFLALIRRTYERFPEYPPYGGEHPEPEPHLTIGEAENDAVLEPLVAAAERELAPGLPLRFRVERIALLAESVDGTWGHVRDFRLG